MGVYIDGSVGVPYSAAVLGAVTIYVVKAEQGTVCISWNLQPGFYNERQKSCAEKVQDTILCRVGDD